MTVTILRRATDPGPYARPAWQGGPIRSLQEVTCEEARCWRPACELAHWRLLPVGIDRRGIGPIIAGNV